MSNIKKINNHKTKAIHNNNILNIDATAEILKVI